MGPMLLTKALQELHPVPIEGSHAWQQDEQVIWAELAVPLIATRSSVPGLEVCWWHCSCRASRTHNHVWKHDQDLICQIASALFLLSSHWGRQ